VVLSTADRAVLQDRARAYVPAFALMVPDENRVAGDGRVGEHGRRRSTRRRRGRDLSWRHPELAAAPGRGRRVEFEYDRRGTLAYFGAYDVHRAWLIGLLPQMSVRAGAAPNLLHYRPVSGVGQAQVRWSSRQN
jgi:hypothetical protein